MTLKQQEEKNLNQLRSEFNGARKYHHVLMELDEEENTLYQWFDVQDCQSFECRIRVQKNVFWALDKNLVLHRLRK